jgi:hypothetical protein
MGRKFLDVTIKTQDEKGHIGIYHATDIHLDSIKFRLDDKKDEKKSKK